MTAASNSEARKRAAGTAASNPTAPEPTGTPEGAPGTDSEALGARALAAELRAIWHDRHRADGYDPMTALGDEARTIAGDVVDSEWLADHDRQIAAAAWFAGYDKGNLDGYFGTSDERGKSPYADLDPYSQEARRG